MTHFSVIDEKNLERFLRVQFDGKIKASMLPALTGKRDRLEQLTELFAPCWPRKEVIVTCLAYDLFTGIEPATRAALLSASRWSPDLVEAATQKVRTSLREYWSNRLAVAG